MTGLILIGLLPFAALGIMLGHLVNVDSIGPASAAALTAGVPRRHVVPDRNHGFLYDVGQLLPSYWLVQASHVALGGHRLDAKAWIVIVGWTIVLAAVARRAYRRDTGRV